MDKSVCERFNCARCVGLQFTRGFIQRKGIVLYVWDLHMGHEANFAYR